METEFTFEDDLTDLNPASDPNILLYSHSPTTSVESNKDWRVNTKVFFGTLWEVISGVKDTELHLYSDSIRQESNSILRSLKVIRSDNLSGDNYHNWRMAWHANDLDWIHGQLLAVSSYKDTIKYVNSNNMDAFKGPLSSYLSLARCLGQIARLGRNYNLMVGSNSLRYEELEKLINVLLFTTDKDTVSIYTLVVFAAQTLRVTPHRLEKAFIKAWKHSSRFKRTITERLLGYPETIVKLSSDGYKFEECYSGSFNFDDGFTTTEISYADPILDV